MLETNDLRVAGSRRLAPPRDLKAELAMTPAANAAVVEGRAAVRAILRRENRRLLVVVGPCSIHDPVSALEYARRLASLSHEVSDQLCVVMRVYFEKPRTTIGWKGLINDPRLDGSCDIEAGLRQARRLLIEINELGLAAGTEFLDATVPQYTADLVAWAAIGARTTESQTHREMASGLSMPVGFKNGTDGSLQIAVDAMMAARHSHHFLGVDQDGAIAIFKTAGNPDGHVVLRGGRARTNYDAASIADAAATLRKAGLPEGVMVDCSHANSGKQHARQEDVWQSLVSQRVEGCPSLLGMMLESHLFEGNQPLAVDASELRYGVSITDACLGWEATERLLRQGAERLRQAAASRPAPAAG